MGHQLITEELVHLFQGTTFGLGIEEDIAQDGDDTEDEEDVKVLEADCGERVRRDLSKDQVQSPIHECGNGVSLGSDVDWENLGRIYPADDACHLISIIQLNREAGLRRWVGVWRELKDYM